MEKLMEILVAILAIIGLACIVKHIMHTEEDCVLCSWSERKEEENRTGTRYGSNPVRY